MAFAVCDVARDLGTLGGLWLRRASSTKASCLPFLQIVVALVGLIADPQFWFNLSVTGMEIGTRLRDRRAKPGLLLGLLLGGNRFLGEAFEPYLAALAATPKIIVLPIVYLMLGVGPASKIAIGAVACFVPIALSVASGMRQISPVLVRVGKSLDLSRWQMVHKIYLPGHWSSPLPSGCG